jgi:anti-sigma factor RsiW
MGQPAKFRGTGAAQQAPIPGAGIEAAMTAMEATAMTCRQVVEFLADYLDGTLDRPARAQFEAHVADCVACTDYMRSYRDTIRLARAAARDDEAAVAAMPSELVDAIVATVDAARGRR